MRRRRMTVVLSVIAALVLPGAILALVSCRTPTLGVEEGRLTDCPDRPNCVGSQASAEEAQVEPFAFEGEPAAAWARLERVVADHPRTTITANEPGYLRAVCRSPLFRFADDLECLLDPEDSVIHVRSSSRVGYSDLGVNQERIEVLRAAFEASRD